MYFLCTLPPYFWISIHHFECPEGPNIPIIRPGPIQIETSLHFVWILVSVQAGPTRTDSKESFSHKVLGTRQEIFSQRSFSSDLTFKLFCRFNTKFTSKNFMNAIVLLDLESKNFEGPKGFEKFRLKTVFFLLFKNGIVCRSVRSQRGCEIHNSCENWLGNGDARCLSVRRAVQLFCVQKDNSILLHPRSLSPIFLW